MDDVFEVIRIHMVDHGLIGCKDTLDSSKTLLGDYKFDDVDVGLLLHAIGDMFDVELSDTDVTEHTTITDLVHAICTT